MYHFTKNIKTNITKKLFNAIIFSLFIIPIISLNTFSQTKKKNNTKIDSVKYTRTPQVEVIGETSHLDKISGSAAIINEVELKQINPISGNEVLRRVTGVHVNDEEGAGLRINLGVRGLDPSRSSKVLMLEDGVPVSLMPYSEPEMYYTPTIDRMSGVEIVKGSSSILYGPNTIGGVVNFLTAEPGKGSRSKLNVKGGQGGFFSGLLEYSSSNENSGLQITYLNKSATNIGVVNFGLNDFTAKLRYHLNENSKIGFKFGIYDEVSNSTYIGLTQKMYESGNYDFTFLAPDDRLNIRRYSTSVTHDWDFANNFQLKTNLYGYTTVRNWSRQDFGYSANSNTIRVIGDSTDKDGGALYFRDGTGNRNRQFEVMGVEPRLKGILMMGKIVNQIEAGVRYHYERAYEQRINGKMINSISGNLVNDEIRTGYAYSAYIQDKVFLSDNFIVTPGLRYENFNYERNILRNGSIDTNIITNNSVSTFIPGFGASFLFSSGNSIFAGVHRGFSPPAITTAITTTGIDQQLDGEFSWNYEIGIRGIGNDYFDYELTTFIMDFSNQIIPISEASGGVGKLAGITQINGGSTLHRGIEAGATLDIAKLGNFKDDIGIKFNTNFTYTQATFGEDRRLVNPFDKFDTINVNGNTLPYAPKYLISSALDITTNFDLNVRFSLTYVSDQFGDEVNSINPSSNGRIGLIPSYTLIDVNLDYYVETIGSSIYLNIKNLSDQRYITTRRPEGIRVGLPRFLTMGINYSLN